LARKFGLGRGLSALIPAEDFPIVKENETVEADSDVRSDIDFDVGIGVETPAEQPEVSVPGASVSNASGKLEADDLPALKVSDAADEEPAVLSNDFVVKLAIDRLVPNPGQPRKNFDETELGELADSIKEHGVIMPIIAADTGEGNYTIIAGERRTRAARLAGLAEVPVIIRNYTDQKRMEISLIENIQRSDLNPIEEATAYKNLMDFSGLSHEELAARVGKNRSTVTNALRLLKLSAEVQKSLESGGLSAGHARALLSVTDDKLREKLFREITARELSVRDAEKKASALNTAEDTDAAKEKTSKRPPEITEMEEKFIEKLGTKVSIAGGLEKGLSRIEYYSMEDLDRLYGLLGCK
jgi:ParB family chromosome partitioning protein